MSSFDDQGTSPSQISHHVNDVPHHNCPLSAIWCPHYNWLNQPVRNPDIYRRTGWCTASLPIIESKDHMYVCGILVTICSFTGRISPPPPFLNSYCPKARVTVNWPRPDWTYRHHERFSDMKNGSLDVGEALDEDRDNSGCNHNLWHGVRGSGAWIILSTQRNQKSNVKNRPHAIIIFAPVLVKSLLELTS